MRRVLPLVAVLLMGFAPAPFPKQHRKTDLKKMQGEWDMVFFGQRGVMVEKRGGFIVKVRFGKDRHGISPLLRKSYHLCLGVSSI